LGASALIKEMNYSPVFNMDIYFLIFGTLLLLLAMFVGNKRKLDRWQGAVFLLLYAGYVVYLIMRNE
jgi:cation:H+ antiporter